MVVDIRKLISADDITNDAYKFHTRIYLYIYNAHYI